MDNVIEEDVVGERERNSESDKEVLLLRQRVKAYTACGGEC